MNLEEATLKMLQEEIQQKSKNNLKETTVKDMYNQLDNTKDVDSVEGLVDNILVVTDPEVTSEEYDEVIDRAQEIIEDTPEGEIPFDEDYVGQYLLTCPICGTTFVSETMLEPGATCPACMEVPEGFVVKGQIQTEEDVAIDNGLQVDDDQATDKETSQQSEEDNTNTGLNNDTEEDEEESERQIASKEMPQGNKLQEEFLTKELNEDTGYDYYGSLEMERFDGPAFIQYNGGPGAIEYLIKARNGRFVWKNAGNGDEPYKFASYDDALKVQQKVGGEILSWNTEYGIDESKKMTEDNTDVSDTTNKDNDTLPTSGDGIEVIVTENSVGYLLRGLIIDNNKKQFQYVQGQALPLGKYKRVSKNTMRNKIEQLQDEGYEEYQGKDSIPIKENVQYAKFERYQIRRIKENNEVNYGIFDLLEQKFTQTDKSYGLIKESFDKINK